MPERTCFWREYCEMSQGSLFSYFTKVGGSGKPRQSGSTHGEVSKKKPRSAVQSNGSAEMDSDSDGDIGVSKMLSGRRKRRTAMSSSERRNCVKRRKMTIESDDEESGSEDEYVPDGQEDNELKYETESQHCTPVKKSHTQFKTPSSKKKSSTPHTPSTFTAPPYTPHTPRTSTTMALGQGGSLFAHDKLTWLNDRNRRDKNGCRANDPEHDSRTLLVPKEYLKSLTPGLRQWWDIKADHFDTVIMFKVGKFYELYHQDAVVGVKELGLCFMKGEFAHSGFPEVAFGRYAQTLVEKGYKVARVEQTETPQMMEQRIKQMSHQPTKFDRVVRRELCSVVTRGTRTLSFLDSNDPHIDSAYLLAVKEEQLSASCSQYGVCFLDTSIGVFHIGQFQDDGQCSRLRTLLAHYPIAQILQERGNLTQRTLTLVNQLLATSIKECLAPNLQFWTSSETLKRLSHGEYFKKTEGDKFEWPPVIKSLLDEVSVVYFLDDQFGLSVNKKYDLAISSLGACVWYLKRCCIEHQLLSLQNFQWYEPLDRSVSSELEGSKNGFSGQRMVLDDVTLINLDVLDHHGNTTGTLLDRIDHTVTSFGKRLLKQWLCAPLCQPEAIEGRLDAVTDLMNYNDIVGGAREGLRRLPDLERLIRKIHSMGLSTGVSQHHADSRAIFYEEVTYSKRKITDFISVLEGFQMCVDVVNSFSTVVINFKSKYLTQLVTTANEEDYKGGKFPKMKEILGFFQSSFNPSQAKKEGVIIPRSGVNQAYDEAMRDVSVVQSKLEEYLQRQRKRLGCKSIVYWGSGRNRFQLEVPESALQRHTPDDYELKSQKKGYKRYWTEEVKNLFESLSSAEERRDNALRDNMRVLFSSFDQHFSLWESAVQCVAQLDVLLSLATYSGCSDGEMCRPVVTYSCDGQPFLEIQSGRHPCVLQTFSGDDFIPNDMLISEEEDRRCVVVTGPNMGGKSTLMRQTGLIVILAHLGSYVPADSCRMSPVDRLFTRLGASDRIMSGESTFFVELTQTSVILRHATIHSLVLLDELGRGTATYDGTAIACAVVRELVEEIHCRVLFSTHYHSLVEEFAPNSHIQLGHMGCVVENEEVEGRETITFLYKFVEGACPKSYGFNVAKLAGLPPDVISVARKKASHFERNSQMSQLFKKLCSTESRDFNPFQLTASLQKLF